MRKIGPTVLVLAAAWLAVAQDPKPQDKPKPDADKDFAMKAANINRGEIEIGRLASKNAINEDCKKFGQTLVDDHTKMQDELKTIAEKKNITMPARLDDKHQRTFDRLSKLSGNDFDREFINEMVKGHEAAVAEFRRYSTDSKDTELKNYATTHLPHLEKHLATARDIQRKLDDKPKPDQPKPPGGG